MARIAGFDSHTRASRHGRYGSEIAGLGMSGFGMFRVWWACVCHCRQICEPPEVRYSAFSRPLQTGCGLKRSDGEFLDLKSFDTDCTRSWYLADAYTIAEI